MKDRKLLLIYTGGTIGMIKNPETGALKAFNFEELLIHVPEIRLLDCDIETYSLEKPIDSSNMNLTHWDILANIIDKTYDLFDGFVILHGSDTMSYTGSALSFMFDNLQKPIILTGSQLPIGDLRTDAKENLITSLQLASQHENGLPIIKEVCIYFEYQLYRANRTSKMNAEHFEAFSSPNYPPLAISGVHLSIDEDLLWNVSKEYAFAKAELSTSYSKKHPDGMIYRAGLDNGVIILKLFPGITAYQVQHLVNLDGIKAVIMESYGSGNAPSEDWFIEIIQAAIERGIHVINVSQCRGGAVNMEKYETGIRMHNIGVISGKDLTIEAALAKCMYLLCHIKDNTLFKQLYETSLRGEMTDHSD